MFGLFGKNKKTGGKKGPSINKGQSPSQPKPNGAVEGAQETSKMISGKLPSGNDLQNRVKGAVRKTAEAGKRAQQTAGARASATNEQIKKVAGRTNNDNDELPPDQRILFTRLRGYLSLNALQYSVYLNIANFFLIAVLVVAITFITNRPPPAPAYFATNPDGTVHELVPLSKPIQTKAALLSWANRVATECFTFNYVDMDRVVKECEDRYFTNKGAPAYLTALAKAKLFKDIKELELFQEAVTPGDDSAQIMQTGMMENRKAYKIRVPLRVSLSGPRNKPVTTSRTILLIAVRVSPLDKPEGVAVHQFVQE